ncbi:unnamed protein product [Pylaiella littoralis]
MTYHRCGYVRCPAWGFCGRFNFLYVALFRGDDDPLFSFVFQERKGGAIIGPQRGVSPECDDRLRAKMRFLFHSAVKQTVSTVWFLTLFLAVWAGRQRSKPSTRAASCLFV